MQFWDMLLTGVVVIIALWYLYRKLVVNSGCSCGSGSCAIRGIEKMVTEQNGPGGCNCDKNRNSSAS